MHSTTLVHLLYLFLLGSSAIVGASPVPPKDGPSDQGSTSGEVVAPVAPVAGKAKTRAPTVAPTPNHHTFPQVDRGVLKEVCFKVVAKLNKLSKYFVDNHGRMPDERTLTETLAYKLGKSAGQISFHTQVQEGNSGTDFIIQMTLTDGLAVDLLNSKLVESMERPPRALLSVPEVNTPASGERTLRSATRAASAQGGASPMEGPAGPAGPAGSPATGKKVVFLLQAKTYHDNGDKNKVDTDDYKKSKKRKPVHGEPERVAQFTYRGSTKAVPDRKLQMHLLSDYADRVRTQIKDAEVIPGYILYGLEELTFTSLQEIINKCHHFNDNKPCDNPDETLDKELSHFFLEKMEEQKRHQEKKCFLEEMIDQIPQ
ncbi:hypothetical protein FRC14_007471 [Serendipita sp. 396]|nr:hypothetical protein FRC14_007471 [Serendipita sp. 396]KAG8784689.1 hypothetical protein FRC15_002793 [Serendipita sp. 397]KAG8817981.1 hypothetical protein FRC18_000297 [Serendipita sp. 400]KAG8865747.1 hypothetical protein FRC20_009539 [Serendipita sp. 405]